MKINQIKSLVLITLVISFFFFQGQSLWHVFDDDNPDIEQPTLESYLLMRDNNNPNTPSVVTIGDYDNFDVGVDNWEQNATSSPVNPLWIFFGANASPQNARLTTNGGLNWILSNPNYHSSTCCDPWTTYTGNNILIYASGVNGQYVYRSTNHGLNWGPAILSVSGNDRNHVSAEYTGTGPYANYVYAGITPGNFARSTNAGLNWTTTFTPSNTQPGCYIAVGPNGAVNGGCVIYVTNTGTTTARTYNFYRSTNGGANFTLMSSQNFVGWVGSLNSAGRFVINGARTAPHPKIAMDNSEGPYRGRLYLVYATNDPPGNGNKPDVWLRYSTNQGANWSSAARINDNANPTASDQWFPEISCERETGRLYIHWYDDRNNPAGYGVDVYATYTDDGGQTFKPNQRLTNVTFSYPNPPCSPNTNCYRGDYTSITGNKDAAFSIWGDHRNGNALNMGSYFPDFAMRVLPLSDTLENFSDSSFYYVSVPGVKLYDKAAFFSATVSPAPVSGNIDLSFLNKNTAEFLDSLTSFPDSLKLRIRTSGGVTPGNYTVTVKGNGLNGTPVHTRNININVTNSPSPLPATITFTAQGYYDTINSGLNIRDSATFYLRNTTAPYAIADSGKSVVDSTSATGTVIFANAPTGTYYVVVKGRNILETWSREGGESYTRGVSFSYNFTTSQSKAYGSNLILKGERYCIYSGDVIQDNTISLTDILLILNDANVFASGYLTNDITGNRIVDLNDVLITYNNSSEFVTRKAPPGVIIIK